MVQTKIKPGYLNNIRYYL